MPDPARWNRLVNQLGGQDELTGKKRTPPRSSNPDAETFSFHPAEVSPYDDGSSRRASTLVTTGSFIGYNDDVDQRAFSKGRATLHRRAFNPGFDREYVWNVPVLQDQQEALYRKAVQQRASINARDNSFSAYLLNDNNCGTWAMFMLTTSGLRFPAGARCLGNAGDIGVGGPMQQSGIPKQTTEAVRAAEEWWTSIYQGFVGIAKGGRP